MTPEQQAAIDYAIAQGLLAGLVPVMVLCFLAGYMVVKR